MDVRLQKRYVRLVMQHMNAATQLAAGIRGLPAVGNSFAATQAAWRFFSNSRVSLPALAEPLRELGCRAIGQSASDYALLVHDWSKVDYEGHISKTDQLQLSNSLDRGYELMTALLVDASTGSPLAPMELSLLASDGRHSTGSGRPQRSLPHLAQLLPTMQASRCWNIRQRLVHVIDREADSVHHFRQWEQKGHLFLVRGDDRRVEYRGRSLLLSEIVEILRKERVFQVTRDVQVRGKGGKLSIAQASVVLSGPAWHRGSKGIRRREYGARLDLRLVVAQVRGANNHLLAQWWLLTNVPDEVPGSDIALWYYWRWRIESFHKLLKSAGLQLESWQQESAAAIARRLLVACMACVVAWQLEAQTTPAAKSCQTFIVRLSGRQMKRSRPVTTSALLAGLHVLLVMLQVLDEYTPNQIRQIATQILPELRRSG